MFFWRNKAESNDRIRDLTKLVTQLREDLDDLGARHERLRGRYYATRGKSQPIRSGTDETNESDSQETGAAAADESNSGSDTGAPGTTDRSGRRRLTKSELLSRYWTPGRPAIHSGS